MGERIRSFDWSKTVLVPVEQWPQSLRTAVRICIGSRNPIVLWWGRSALTQFYNDAFISFLGNKKHPGFLGGSARECWSEIWEPMGPMLEHVFTTGEATWSEDFLYVLNRNLPREGGYFTFSYSPFGAMRKPLKASFARAMKQRTKFLATGGCAPSAIWVVPLRQQIRRKRPAN